jgi:hypothetical protein
MNPIVKKKISTLLDTENLYLGGNLDGMIVYYKPVLFTLHWRYESKSEELYYKNDLDIQNGARPIPKLLFKYVYGRLSVFAYKEWNGENTVFYHAPFHNIYSNGGVCMGSAGSRIKVLKNDTFKTFTHRVSKLFFLVPGSEIHNKWHMNLNSFHKELITMDTFPEHILEPINIDDESTEDE